MIKGKTLAWALSMTLAGMSLSGMVQAEEKYVTIGTGGQTGVYYVAGQSICRFINRDSKKTGVRCNAPASGGGVANVNGIRSGEFNFGVMQSDHQYKAMKGLAPFEAEGPMDDMRALFSLQSEVFTVLARRDSHIANFNDLKGKRVNIGNPGSGQRDTLEEIMEKKGWDRKSFSLANGAIQEATTTVDAVLVPVTGPEIDALLAEKSYYTKAEIPGGIYTGNDLPTPSIGGKAVLSTSSKVSDDLVYQLVKSVFDNLDRFKRLHPAFKDLKAEEMIEAGLSAPLHDGAIRYYKERGWL